MDVGDPALLHSWMRGRLVDQRDRLLDDAEFMSLTIPDAHDLVRQVQLALDTALPRIEMW